MKKRVLFVCTGNSARSQMAEALLRDLGGDRYDVYSAGTNPKSLHPVTIEAMREIGIDVSGQQSKELGKFAGQAFDYVVTVCDSAKQQCPVFPGARAFHWDLADPAATATDRATQLSIFRRSRNQIRELVRQFLKEASAAD